VIGLWINLSGWLNFSWANYPLNLGATDQILSILYHNKNWWTHQWLAAALPCQSDSDPSQRKQLPSPSTSRSWLPTLMKYPLLKAKIKYSLTNSCKKSKTEHHSEMTVLSAASCLWRKVWRKSERLSSQRKRMNFTCRFWRSTASTRRLRRLWTSWTTRSHLCLWLWQGKSKSPRHRSHRSSTRHWRAIRLTHSSTSGRASTQYRNHSYSRLPSAWDSSKNSLKTTSMMPTKRISRTNLSQLMLVNRNNMNLCVCNLNATSNCAPLTRRRATATCLASWPGPSLQTCNSLRAKS